MIFFTCISKHYSLQSEEESTVKKQFLEEGDHNPPKHANKSEKRVYEEKVQLKV